MCNDCKCSEDLYDRCSILGHIPIGHCCPMCINYELRHECENYYFTLGRTIDPSFKMGNKEKSKEKEQDEEVTLIINKRGQ